MKNADTNKLKALIKGCRKQKRASQKQLYKEFYAYGMSICIRYVSNRDEAAEVLNDAFMKVFENIHKFDLNKSFKPWLRTILINTAINFYNKKQRQYQTEEINDAIEETDTEDVLSHLSYQEIVGLIQELSPQYRTVFNLYVIEGYKHEEIAKKLDIAIGTSKSNLAKAKKRLQEKLNNFFLSEIHERR